MEDLSTIQRQLQEGIEVKKKKVNEAIERNQKSRRRQEEAFKRGKLERGAKYGARGSKRRSDENIKTKLMVKATVLHEQLLLCDSLRLSLTPF